MKKYLLVLVVITFLMALAPTVLAGPIESDLFTLQGPIESDLFTIESCGPIESELFACGPIESDLFNR